MTVLLATWLLLVFGVTVGAGIARRANAKSTPSTPHLLRQAILSPITSVGCWPPESFVGITFANHSLNREIVEESAFAFLPFQATKSNGPGFRQSA